jgi:glycosyltransferase involved in cell wall biosynthesis
MRIAYIIPSTIKSGPVKVVHQLVSKLSVDHEIDIYFFKDVSTREHFEFPCSVKKIDFFEKIDFSQYDILHTHTIMPDAYVWYHKRKTDRVKTVSTLHNYAYEDLRYSYGKVKGTLMAFLWNIVTTRHDMLVTLSKSAQHYYQQRWFNKSLTYIYNGIDIDMNDKVEKRKNSHCIKIGNIASAGGINKRKGIEQVIKALQKLPKEYELYIAGKENDESLRLMALAKKLHVESRVYFEGYVTDIKSFVDDMDIFVVSPRSEGFGLSLLECIQRKKGVVCSDIEIFREIFTEEEVLFFTIDNIDNLVEKIQACYIKKDELAEKAYRRFVNQYSSDIMAKKYIKLYQSLKESL